MYEAEFAARETFFPTWADRMIVPAYGAPTASSEVSRIAGFYAAASFAPFGARREACPMAAFLTPTYGAPRADSEIAALDAFFCASSSEAFGPRPIEPEILARAA